MCKFLHTVAVGWKSEAVGVWIVDKGGGLSVMCPEIQGKFMIRRFAHVTCDAGSGLAHIAGFYTAKNGS
jgi:hypothetical protein